MSLEAKLVPVKRRRGKGKSRQKGGFSIAGLLSGLNTANQIAKAVKPATLLANVLDSTGASKGKVGKVIRDIASVGQQFGYGHAVYKKKNNKRNRNRIPL